MMELQYGKVKLVELELIHLDYDYYLYSIEVDTIEVGKLTFRIGSDDYFILDGHVGYEIEEAYRGHHYAYQACKALEPKIKEYYNHILITCDPENLPSKKTIEKLNTTFLENRRIPGKLKDYYPGSNSKDIYRWDI